MKNLDDNFYTACYRFIIDFIATNNMWNQCSPDIHQKILFNLFENDLESRDDCFINDIIAQVIIIFINHVQKIIIIRIMIENI